MRKLRLYIIGLVIPFFGLGQIDTNIMLISKIDAFLNFSTHDGVEHFLMGYSHGIGGGVDLPSPTITLTEGDSVRLSMWNLSQGAPHTIHLHGLDVNQENDGVPNLSFAVMHDDTGHYEFKTPHPGTYIYHCHVISPIHVQAGMYGMIIVKPEQENLVWQGGPSFNKEFSFLFSELDTEWHHDTIIHDMVGPNDSIHYIPEYDPEYFLVNGRSQSQLIAEGIEVSGHANDSLLLRLANIGNLINKLVLPSELNAQLISSDGRPLPSFLNGDTIEMYPGERFQVLCVPSEEFNDSIEVAYIDMNDEEIEGIEYIQVVIEGFKSINETEFNFTIYPNPANDFVHIESGLLLEEVSIIDLTGRVVLFLEMNAERTQLDLSNLSSGYYSIIAKSKHKTSIKQLVITNN